VRNEKVLHKSKGRAEFLTCNKKEKDNWIALILRSNCLLKHFIEGKLGRGIDVTGRQGRRSKQLLGDLKKTRRY
jgi:hypothetical protein